MGPVERRNATTSVRSLSMESVIENKRRLRPYIRLSNDIFSIMEPRPFPLCVPFYERTSVIVAKILI